MPRRRKKHQANKHSLSFTESPVALYNDAISPVHCADEPPTADVVALDENTTVQWVSPQFRGQINAMPRQLRCKSNGLSVTQSHHQSHIGKSQVYRPNPRLKPLNFVQLNTQSPGGIGDEVGHSHMSDDDAEFTKLKPRDQLHHRLDNINSLTMNAGGACGERQCRKVLSYHRDPEADCNMDVLANDIVKETDGSVSAQLVESAGNTLCPILGDTSFHTPLQTGTTNNYFIERGILQDLASTPVSQTVILHQREVLVADTPEQDYGLPVRLRRLRTCK